MLSTISFFIADRCRRLYMDELVYCLYEQTRKGELQWHVYQDLCMRTSDDGFSFIIITAQLVVVVDESTATVTDVIQGRGIHSLLKLAQRMHDQPLEERQKQKISEYIKGH